MISVAGVMDIFFYHVIISRRSFIDDSYRRSCGQVPGTQSRADGSLANPVAEKARQKSLRGKRPGTRRRAFLQQEGDGAESRPHHLARRRWYVAQYRSLGRKAGSADS